MRLTYRISEAEFCVWRPKRLCRCRRGLAPLVWETWSDRLHGQQTRLTILAITSRDEYDVFNASSTWTQVNDVQNSFKSDWMRKQ